MSNENLTQNELKKYLNYNPITGIFTWIKLASINQIKIGSLAGALIKRDGYIVIKINNKSYRAHRLAWLYMTGKWPNHFIDHINLNRADNKFSNLREATNKENCRNATLKKSNSSGYKGVHYNKKLKKWIAQASSDSLKRYLGLFETAELASEAYKNFAKIHHGKFYRD